MAAAAAAAAVAPMAPDPSPNLAARQRMPVNSSVGSAMGGGQEDSWVPP